MSEFARDTAVEKIGEGIYRGELVAGWRIGEVPNGGYVLAVAGRALRAALPHADPLSVSAFYLAPTVLGPVECHLRVLRAGRGTSFADVDMFQQDELKVRVTAAYTDLERLDGESWSRLARPRIPPWEECGGPPGKDLEFRRRVELRLAAGREAFAQRSPDGSGEFNGWVRHADGADPDVIALLMFADALPPPIFTVYGPLGWVPTVELTVQVRAHPAPGPLQARLSSRELTRGVVEEDGEYWDSDGRLVALSRQTAKVRLPGPQ
ncbi:MAG: thioesterase family protein [Halioglobus sp.]|nr:thioesterase family protein [Halioglobus sp.]